MKNLYIKLVKFMNNCLVFIINKTMRHLVFLSGKNPDKNTTLKNNIYDCLDFEETLKSVSEYMKPPTHTFGRVFNRTDRIEEDEKNKVITIQIPRVIFPVRKEDTEVSK
jgi:hypothetical protein